MPSRLLSFPFICVVAILISMLVLAQSNRLPVANEANGRPAIRKEPPGPLSSLSEIQQWALLPQIRSVGPGVRTVLGPRLRRRARSKMQTGPEQVLYAFQGDSDGAFPSGSLIFDSPGNLYGTT